jgi:uncharacterized membrane-anchored protein
MYGVVLTVEYTQDTTEAGFPKVSEYIHTADTKSAVSSLITDTMTNVRNLEAKLTKVLVVDESVTPYRVLDNSEVFDILIAM